MVHAAIAEAQPGEVLVLTMPEPAPVALVGELLATQAKGRGVAAMLVDAAVRDVEELRELGLPIWARCVRVRGADKKRAGRDRRAGRGRRRDDPPGRRGRARRRRRRRRRAGARRRGAGGALATRAEREREKRAKLEAGRALLRPRRPARARRGSDRSPPRRRPDRARRAADAEAGREPALLRRRARDGGGGARGAVGLPARLGRLPPLQPEADRVAADAGLGHMALRAWSPEALERRVAAIEATGLGTGWIDGDVGHGPAYRFTDPDGHVFELYYEAERYVAARAPEAVVAEPAAALRRARRGGQAARPRQRARRRRARRTASSPRSVLGYRLYERIELDDGTEAGAWLSLSIAAHELIYVADALRRARPPAPPRVLGRHARGVPARRRPVRRQRRPDRGRAVEARRRAGVLPLRLRAGRQPDRGDDRRLLRLRPGLRADRRGRRRSAPAASSGACRRSRASTPTARRTSRRAVMTRALRDPALRRGRGGGRRSCPSACG